VLPNIADGDLINDDMNSDAESKSLENQSSEEEIVTQRKFIGLNLPTRILHF
jgi:hypothetical protein